MSMCRCTGTCGALIDSSTVMSHCTAFKMHFICINPQPSTDSTSFQSNPNRGNSWVRVSKIREMKSYALFTIPLNRRTIITMVRSVTRPPAIIFFCFRCHRPGLFGARFCFGYEFYCIIKHDWLAGLGLAQIDKTQNHSGGDYPQSGPDLKSIHYYWVAPRATVLWLESSILSVAIK